MTPSPSVSIGWMRGGTDALFSALEDVRDEQFAAPSPLPGWNRTHLLAHVASNADALGRLVHWAASGQPTPMYESPQHRVADIESGSTKSPPEIRAWLKESATALNKGIEALPSSRWEHPVVTARGRTVPATEIPWMRTREVWIHAVDLDAGFGFDDFPESLLIALIDEIVVHRSGQSDHPGLTLETPAMDRTWAVRDGEMHLRASLPKLAEYLTGRRPAPPGLPSLPAWL